MAQRKPCLRVNVGLAAYRKSLQVARGAYKFKTSRLRCIYSISVYQLHSERRPTSTALIPRLVSGDTEYSTILSDRTDKSLRGPNGL